ncbi:hypothetical protein CPB86DRAFT_785103 [Serendipita vermifera]|nr:hypothetical protein CPB86DRAFT_785103 [Serendipita vermifera]
MGDHTSVQVVDGLGSKGVLENSSVAQSHSPADTGNRSLEQIRPGAPQSRLSPAKPLPPSEGEPSPLATTQGTSTSRTDPLPDGNLTQTSNNHPPTAGTQKDQESKTAAAGNQEELETKNEDLTTPSSSKENPDQNAMSKENKPSVTIPQLQWTQPTSSSSDIMSPTNEGPSLSKRNSKYASGGSSRRNSKRNSKHNSVTSLVSTRPAPPSPASSNPSRRTSQAYPFPLTPSRRQSTHSQLSDHSTERSPSQKNSSSSLRKSFQNANRAGSLSISSSRRHSTLVMSFTNPALSADISDFPNDQGPSLSPLNVASERETLIPTEKAPLPPTNVSSLDDQSINANLDAVTGFPSRADSTPRYENPLQRNLSSISASTSGSASSTPSKAAARHVNELEAAYGLYAAPQEVVKEPEITNAPEPNGGMDPEDIQWYHEHPIVVRDYAFEEDDERFSKVPLELLPASERPTQNRGERQGGQHGWDVTYDEDEDEDEWGWPVGTISGGNAPLGTFTGGGQDLRNRSRAWNGLGSRGVGGLYTGFSEEESSGFYEESGEEEHEENELPTRNDGDEEDDNFTGDVHTPLHSYSYHLHPHPDLEMDGVDGDEDSSPESSDREDSPLRPGIYRVLFAFTAESLAEMSVNEDQLIRVLGRGGGEGWVVALRTWTPDRDIGTTSHPSTEEENHEEEHGLVPESYIELHQAETSVGY